MSFRSWLKEEYYWIPYIIEGIIGDGEGQQEENNKNPSKTEDNPFQQAVRLGGGAHRGHSAIGDILGRNWMEEEMRNTSGVFLKQGITRK